MKGEEYYRSDAGFVLPHTPPSGNRNPEAVSALNIRRQRRSANPHPDKRVRRDERRYAGQARRPMGEDSIKFFIMVLGHLPCKTAGGDLLYALGISQSYEVRTHGQSLVGIFREPVCDSFSSP